MSWAEQRAGRAGAPALLGRYRLVHRIGEGGMGVVHLAIDPDGRAVAVKVLRAHVAGDPDARARLAREVSTLRRVRHRRIAEVLDADVESDRPFVVTRFVPGQPLDALVRAEGPLQGSSLAALGRRDWRRPCAPSTARASCTATSSPATSWCWTASRWSSTSASPRSRTTSG